MASNFVNYYKILQVDPEAETDVIEATYRRLALKYHPDVNKSSDAEEKMKLFNEARSILTNPQKRRKYDQEFEQFTQNRQTQNQNTSRKREAVEDDDVWNENAVRDLAAQILIIIQQSLQERKWRVAREKLYVFEGLGTQPKDNRVLPTFGMLLPEWQKAKELDTLANQQEDEFKKNLQKRSFIFYGILLALAGIVMGAVENEVGFAFVFGLLGAGLGFPIGAIGTWIYSKWYAGKWGEGTDNAVGLLTPLILSLVITVGIYIILAYLILGGLFSSLSGDGKKKR